MEGFAWSGNVSAERRLTYCILRDTINRMIEIRRTEEYGYPVG